MDGRRWGLLADSLWRHLEAYHAQVYFAPEHREAMAGLGLRGGWMAYFASRAAPLGRVPATVVTALFYNFHQRMVARAIPDAWDYATPSSVIAARERALGAAMSRILGRVGPSPDVREAAALARRIATAADTAGRPMFAANLALDWPDEPHLALWHASTLLREHRGDGHVAALLTAGIDGCQAHVLQVAAGVVERHGIQPHRGWTDEEWDVAAAELMRRGLLLPDGGLTALGRDIRGDVRARTDALAVAPLRRVGEATVRRLLEGMAPISQQLRAAGDLPYPNPIGVGEP